MPASRTQRQASLPSPLTARTPRGLGYAAYLDDNVAEVFTRLDQSGADLRDVVPFNRVEYPTRNQVR